MIFWVVVFCVLLFVLTVGFTIWLCGRPLRILSKRPVCSASVRVLEKSVQSKYSAYGYTDSNGHGHASGSTTYDRSVLCLCDDGNRMVVRVVLYGTALDRNRLLDSFDSLMKDDCGVLKYKVWNGVNYYFGFERV